MKWAVIPILVLLILQATIHNVVAQTGPEEPNAECQDYVWRFNRTLPENERTIPASTIEHALKSAVEIGCRVDVWYAIVDGDLDLSKELIPPVSFFSTIFNGEVNFTDAVFSGEVINLINAPVLLNPPTSESAAAREIEEGIEGRPRGGFGFSSLGETTTSFASVFSRGVHFDRARFEGSTDFSRTRFLDDANFSSVDFVQSISFSDVIFTETVRFLNTTFSSDRMHPWLTMFEGVTFDRADFSGAKFRGFRTDFTDAKFNGWVLLPSLIDSQINGLNWESVKDTNPPNMTADNFMGQWENFFVSGKRYSEATKVRTAQRHARLKPVWIWLAIGYFSIAILFWIIYSTIWFRSSRHASNLWLLKVLLFSFDTSTPGIGPTKYDWQERGRLSVDTISISVLTAVQGFLGWAALVLAGAVTVAWIIA